MTIIVEKPAGYRRITLNRPERLNALTVEMADALSAALDAAKADPSCRALLITGAGRAFCAGQQDVDASPCEQTRRLLRFDMRLTLERALAAADRSPGRWSA